MSTFPSSQHGARSIQTVDCSVRRTPLTRGQPLTVAHEPHVEHLRWNSTTEVWRGTFLRKPGLQPSDSSSLPLNPPVRRALRRNFVSLASQPPPFLSNSKAPSSDSKIHCPRRDSDDHAHFKPVKTLQTIYRLAKSVRYPRIQKNLHTSESEFGRRAPSLARTPLQPPRLDQAPTSSALALPVECLPARDGFSVINCVVNVQFSCAGGCPACRLVCCLNFASFSLTFSQSHSALITASSTTPSPSTSPPD